MGKKQQLYSENSENAVKAVMANVPTDESRRSVRKLYSRWGSRFGLSHLAIWSCYWKATPKSIIDY